MGFKEKDTGTPAQREREAAIRRIGEVLQTDETLTDAQREELEAMSDRAVKLQGDWRPPDLEDD